MRRKYTLTLTITEGNDEFWESLGNKTGCDEIRDAVAAAMTQVGFDPDIDEDCTLMITSYTND